jgi:hypothetical protein
MSPPSSGLKTPARNQHEGGSKLAERHASPKRRLTCSELHVISQKIKLFKKKIILYFCLAVTGLILSDPASVLISYKYFFQFRLAGKTNLWLHNSVIHFSRNLHYLSDTKFHTVAIHRGSDSAWACCAVTPVQNFARLVLVVDKWLSSNREVNIAFGWVIFLFILQNSNTNRSYIFFEGLLPHIQDFRMEQGKHSPEAKARSRQI